MNGTGLALGVAGVLAVAGAARRGSRAELTPDARDLADSLREMREALASKKGDWWSQIHQGWRYLKNNRIVRLVPEYRLAAKPFDDVVLGLSKFMSDATKTYSKSRVIEPSSGRVISYEELVGEAWGHRRGELSKALDVLQAALPSPLDAVGRQGSRALSPSMTRQQAHEAFFDALERRAGAKQVAYFGPFQIVGDRKGGVLGKLEVRVSGSEVVPGLVVHLGFLGVLKDERGEGRGGKLLGMVVAAADEVGLPVELHVKPMKEYGQRKPPMNKVQLRAFYGKFGFKPFKGRSVDFMRREVGG